MPLPSKPSETNSSTGWQPIETAPQNGTPILLAFDRPLHSRMIERHVPFVELHCSMGWWDESWIIPFMEEGVADSNGYSSTFYMGEIHPLPVNPIRWMPLPLPPANEERGSSK